MPRKGLERFAGNRGPGSPTIRGLDGQGLIRESGAQAYGFISRVGAEYGSGLVHVQAVVEPRVQIRNPSSG